MTREPFIAIEGGFDLDISELDGAAFDLDGVITRTAAAHAAAWKRVFDGFLKRRADRDGKAFRPFDIEEDYLSHVDGRPRLDGVRQFLSSRTIILPEGDSLDTPERETVWAIANLKNKLFGEALAQTGVEVFESSVAFVRTLREAGMTIAVVSASQNTEAVLAAAGLADIFDVRVDGVEAARLGLKGKPSPDTFLHAARMLGVSSTRALGVEDSLAGVEAIKAAGFALVIGVDRAGQKRELAARGADIVVPDLGALRTSRADRPDRAAGVRADSRKREFLSHPVEPRSRPVERETEPGWLLIEEGFTLTREHEVESMFAIGNGFMGTRGSLAEGSKMSSPATFIAGVFHTVPGASPGLATVPDWTRLSIAVEGQPLRLDAGRCLDHRRILDLRQGSLWREWRHQDASGRITRIGELRLASLADRHLLIQSMTLCPENYSGEVSIDATIEGTPIVRTSTGVTVALAVDTRLVDPAGGTKAAGLESGPRSIRVELGQSYRIERIGAVRTSRESHDPPAAAQAQVASAVEAGIARLIDDHRRSWARRWKACDLEIEGDLTSQRAARFAIYHLISAANPEDDCVSIGARALTGSAYNGHVFWDTEMFMLPFFALTWPKAAKSLLAYRHRTIGGARKKAEQFGYGGALYAWESADSGDEVTPKVAVWPDGKAVSILTGELEQHISADVAYAAWRYWQATFDVDFLLEAGAEIILETARFWASRVERQEDGLYHILGVIGPDEYHENVDDNAFTNGMAKWNLLIGEQLVRLLQERWPDRWRALSKRLGLDADEPRRWLAIAGNVYTGLNRKTGLIEQFRGYFLLEDIDLAAFEPRNAPIDVLLGRERVGQSKIIKQPDVVMLLHLLWDDFAPRARETNFGYYAPRCAHGSSLSPSIHALVAARLGQVELAYRYFRQAVEIDIGNNMGNAAGGVHAAALGGLWQAIVFGFAGLHFADDAIRYRAHLPLHWRGLSARFVWRGQSYALKLPRVGRGRVRKASQ